MNAKARQLGLTNTHYANPIGLDSPGKLLDRRRSDQPTLIQLRSNPFLP